MNMFRSQLVSKLVMQIKSNNTKLLLLSCLIFFSGQILSEEVIKNELQLRKILSPLGENIVGKSLPGIVINNPHRYTSGRTGKYIYQIILKDNDDTITKFEKRSEFDSGIGKSRKWSTEVDNDFIEEWESDSKGNIHLVAQSDVDSGYRVVLVQHLLLPAGAQQGQHWKSVSSLKVYETSDPDIVVNEGELLSDKAYVGRFEITTPAGKFDAILISDDYEIKIGSVNIKDKRYTFYALDVGKIAEIDGFHVSAFLFFHKRRSEAKVLMRLPQSAGE